MLYDLKICLRNEVDLSVVYDKSNREVMISLLVNGVEVLATEEPIAVERISSKNIKKDFNLIISDISSWLEVVNQNPNFERSTTWERN